MSDRSGRDGGILSSELRVGIVGAGWIASVHGHAYRASPGVRVTAVTDPVTSKAERLAEQTGARVVRDLDELMAAGVHVVDVCTPPQTHADLAIRALEAGLHVICEKPLARTMDDARRMAEAAADAPGLLMVGHVSRYEPDHATAKSLLDQGRIGRLRMITHSTATSLPGWSEAGWLADTAKSGGPLVDQAVHSFDYFGWLTGSPAVRVSARGAGSGAGPATYCLAIVRYADGTIAQAEVSWAHPPARGFKLAAELVGTAGRLTWSYDQMMGGVLYPRVGDPEWYDVLADRGFTAELRDFTDAIRSGGPSPVPAEQGVESLRVALGALESVRTSETIDLTTWERA
jgi:myo-inositol 2-dehydrogenase/D-chiro-inositol 1-dehydrogenase